MTDYRARVHRGAALLDEKEPGWWERVTETLITEDCTACVLGQVYGSYGDALIALGVGVDDAWLGFEARPNRDAHVVQDAYATLDTLWLEAIAQRREANS